MTLTNEPFQPVRLYYTIPSDEGVIEKLRALKCMIEGPGVWEWIFEAEAADLKFSSGATARGYLDIPEEKRLSVFLNGWTMFRRESWTPTDFWLKPQLEAV